jgi:hypothetical protein
MPYQSAVVSDTLRALVVFARFQDDTSPHSRDWPADRRAAPEFAADLLAPSPNPSTFPDASLTRYLHDQSNGLFTVFGAAYPSVVVTTRPEEYYRSAGWGHLTQDVLDQLDRDPSFSFADFDANGDGFVDYLFLIIRKDNQKTYGWAGVSDLRGAPPRSGGPNTCLEYDGKKVDWRFSGSILINDVAGNVIPRAYYAPFMAHEMGHDLWATHFLHLSTINGIALPSGPENPRQGNARHLRPQNRVGYALMGGAGGAHPVSGGPVISAHERALLGWIACEPLTTDRDGVTITDLATTGSCYSTEILHGSRPRTLTLSNLQREAYYTQMHRFCEDGFARDGSCGAFYAEIGQMATGILPTLSDGVRYSELPADNTLEAGIREAVYSGDLFGGVHGTQLTPWTTPSISGASGSEGLTTTNWQAIDNIRYTGGPGGEMAFDFVVDARTRPIIRRDSRMGSEMDGSTLSGQVVVLNGSRLTVDVQGSGSMTFAEGMHIERGSEVVLGGPGQFIMLRQPIDVDAGATLLVRDGTTIVHEPEAFFRTQAGARVEVASGVHTIHRR